MAHEILLFAVITVWLTAILNGTASTNNLVSAAVCNFALSSVSHRCAEPCVVVARVPGDHKTVLCAVPHPNTRLLIFRRQKSCHSHL
jgi:hypothetical protein